MKNAQIYQANFQDGRAKITANDTHFFPQQHSLTFDIMQKVCFCYCAKYK